MTRRLGIFRLVATASLILACVCAGAVSAADKPPAETDSKVEIVPRAKRSDVKPTYHGAIFAYKALWC